MCAVASAPGGGRSPSLVPYVAVTGPNDARHRLRRAFMLPILLTNSPEQKRLNLHLTPFLDQK
jgi:hypothetical protein